MIDTIILDRGHGTINAQGVYTTAPSKMFTFKDGTIAYEGVINNLYLEKISEYVSKACLNIVYTVRPKDPTDVSLTNRINIANNYKKRKSSFFLSIHNNASLKGNAKGSEIWTSVGQTVSDVFAENTLKMWKQYLGKERVRIDKSDGDLDKESNFRVLKETKMPAMLLEIGFFDNEEDYKFITNPETIDLVSKITVQAIVNTIRDLYNKEHTNFLIDVL